MVVIGVAAAGAALSAGQTGFTLALIAAATAAATVGAAYLDQRYVYPKLFGTDDPRQPATVPGIDQMTGDDGAPGTNAWGRAALVGGHVLFFEKFEFEGNRVSNKKSGPVTFTRRLATVGIAWCHSRIASVERVLADQKSYWDRDPNLALWTDYRAGISPNAGNLVVLALSESVAEFQPIFGEGNVVKMEGALASSGAPSPMNGYWRVVSVTGAAINGGLSSITLSPLSGQTPAIAGAGSQYAPMVLRRIDIGVVDSLIAAGPSPYQGGGKAFEWKAYFGGNGIVSGFQQSDSNYARDPRPLFQAGTIVRVSGLNNASYNGLFRIVEFQDHTGSVFIRAKLTLQPIGGGNLPTWNNSFLPTPNPSNPPKLVMEPPFGFYDYSEGQEMLHYIGTETEGADPDLTAIYGGGNAHGYRGQARSTIRKYNLSNFGDRVAQHSAVVRVSEHHTTHDPIRDLVAEAFAGDQSRVDFSGLPAQPLLGFARRGPQPTSSVLQPLAIAYGIEAQEVGPRFRFFDAANAHQIQLGEDDFGCYAGRRNPLVRKLKHSRVPDRDLPRVLTLAYRDPTADYSRRTQTARSGRPLDLTQEQGVIDVDPVCLWPWHAQNEVRRLYLQALVGRDQGETMLPPSRCYVLPNDRLTFTANNRQDEFPTIASGAVGHTASKLPIELGSATMEVTWATRGNCRVVDRGDGVWVGLPTGLTGVTNSIDYSTGAIVLGASNDTILSARLIYEFPHPWKMRVQGITRQANRCLRVTMVAVAEKFAVLGSPVQFNQPAFQPTINVPELEFHVIDEPSIHPSQGLAYRGLLWAACPRPGSTWGGAIAMSSGDNGLNWSTHGLIERPTPMGSATTTLAAGTTATWDWTNTLTVKMTYGAPDSQTPAEIDALRGWGLIGQEIIAWREAVPGPDPDTFTLRGLLRGLRNTEEHVATHVADERFVILTNCGFGPNDERHGLFEDSPAPVLAGPRLYRIVPVGAPTTFGPAAVSVTVRGRARRPFSIGLIQQIRNPDDSIDPSVLHHEYDPSAWGSGQDVVIRWWRRHRAPGSFGAPYPLWESYERYRVTIKADGVAVWQEFVGDPIAGSIFIEPVYRVSRDLQDQLGLGASGQVIRIEIEQEGMFEFSPPTAIEWTVP